MTTTKNSSLHDRIHLPFPSKRFKWSNRLQDPPSSQINHRTHPEKILNHKPRTRKDWAPVFTIDPFITKFRRQLIRNDKGCPLFRNSIVIHRVCSQFCRCARSKVMISISRDRCRRLRRVSRPRAPPPLSPPLSLSRSLLPSPRSRIWIKRLRKFNISGWDGHIKLLTATSP